MQHDNTDLEHLNFTELLEERVTVKARIREIVAERAVTGRPDDRLYRAWLRSINAENGVLADRLDQIKVMLAKRQQEHASVRGPKAPLLTPEQHHDLEERRRKLREDLAAGGPDALLIRCRRVFNNLCDGIPYDDLPLDSDDRDTLRDVSVYLRGRYGSTPVKEATHGGSK